MTLKELFKEAVKLMEDPKNHNKQIIGDVRPGEYLKELKLYGKHFVVLVDERAKM